MQPGQRVYPTSQTPFATVDIRYGFGQDLYVILGEFDRGAGQWATMKAQIHPLIAWIWIGGVVVVAGGLVAIWPGRRRVPAMVTAGEAAAISGASDAP